MSRSRSRSTGQFVELARASGFVLAEYRCTACRGERPYPEQHRAISAALVLSGSFGYAIRKRTHYLVPGSFLLGEPGEEYACSHDHDGGDRCLTVRFDAARVADVLATEGLRGEPERPFGDVVAPPLVRLAAALLSTRSAALGRIGISFEEAGHLFLAELLGALRSADPREAASQDPRRSDVERALDAVDYIEAHAPEPMALAEVARAVDLSPFHFLRLFRRVLGLTPHQLLLRTRIRRAAMLLLDGKRDASVTDIAYGVGFGDLSNFVRTFGRLIGCSPRQLRRGGVPAQQSKILQERPRRPR